MKIKTLLLGTVAAVGLSTAAMAADPAAVLTSLDICDELNISGLTISSDDNCLQISGGVEYEFNWGDYRGTVGGAGWLHTLDDNDFAPLAADNNDWNSKVDAWLKVVGTADSDFGPAKAVIKLGYDQDTYYWNEANPDAGNADVDALVVDEAYVSVGDGTVLSAGKKGSIAALGHDTGYNYLGLRHDDFGLGGVSTGGNVIQLESDLGNGVGVALGLEDLAGMGSLIGVLTYAGDTVVAHITVGADDVLTGTVSEWAVHAGAEVTVDMFKFLVAGGFQSITGAAQTGWNVMASVEAGFDMFTLAASVAASNDGSGGITPATTDNLELAVSIAADVTDTVTVKLGAQWDDENTGIASDEQWKVAAQLVAAVTENVTLTAEIGVDGKVPAGAPTTVAYGSVEAAWAPGGGFTSSVKGWGNAEGAYKLTFKAAKSF